MSLSDVEIFEKAAQFEHQRRLNQNFVQEQYNNALKTAKASVRPPAFYSKHDEKLFHDQQIRIADILNDTLRSWALSQEHILATAQTSPLASKLIIGLLQQPPAAPNPPEEPALSSFLPNALSGLDTILPWKKQKYSFAVEHSKRSFKAALEAHRVFRETQETIWKADCALVASYNNQIFDLINRIKSGDVASTEKYQLLALETTPLFPYHAPRADVAFIPTSNHLVINYYLPELSILPDYISASYVRARKQIQLKPMAPKERKARYADLISKMALAALEISFRNGLPQHVEAVTLNGILETTDPARGHPIRPCLLSVRTSRDNFDSINLSKVAPVECLKALKANVSSNPDELVPVRPIFEMDMTDPRFINTEDVLSGLDERANLMDLSPSQFEQLITNLFSKMGLETRLTQASRDGGVDCVAFDQRPILGGKVVIQAKRYKNTVGVSAVRDLFGTMQNEGASKGILVTTSGYGKAAFDFAAGKPIELLDGAHLLFLLEERAGLKCKIVMPRDQSDTGHMAQ